MKRSFIERILAVVLCACFIVMATGCGSAANTDEDKVIVDNGPATGENHKENDEKGGSKVNEKETTVNDEKETAEAIKPNGEKTADEIVKVEYPESVQRVNEEAYWNPDLTEAERKSLDEQSDAFYKDLSARRQIEYDQDALSKYWSRSTETFMNSATDNVVYSPVNVFLCIAMLAEITDGNSRAQVLNALGFDSLDELRDMASALWKTNYYDMGSTTSLLGASLWMNKEVDYKRPALENLATKHFAAAYSGEMGSAEYDAQLQNWLNERTNHLLEDAASKLHMDASTILALATTIYFKGGWHDKFYDGANTEENFTNADQSKTKTTFMNQTHEQSVYFGKYFTAVSKSLSDGCNMWFLLPNEGTTAAELAKDPVAQKFMFDPDNSGITDNRYRVHLSVPKFDVDSNLDLIEGMQALGMTDIFDGSLSNFTPLTDMDDLAVGSATHAARVKIDEDGVEAAAFTVMMVGLTAMMPREYEDFYFTLDRPFLFTITNDHNLPLFEGIVNSVK